MPDIDDDVITRERTTTRLQEPSMYKVLMLNDDFTPMDFVIMVLMQIFQKSEQEALQLMLHVHNQGKGIAGIYPYEVAYDKQQRTIELTQTNQHPLEVVLEKE